MKIEKIILNNFRGFEGEHTIELHPQLNVFVGRNGAGKSSILDALGMLLLSFLESIDFADEKQFLINSDINSDSEYLNIAFDISSVFNEGNALNNELFKDLHLEAEGGGPIFPGRVEVIYELWNLIKKSPAKFNFPLIRYFRLSPVVQADKKEEYKFEQLNTYKNAFSSSTDFKTFTTWFINEENEENRTKVKTRNLDYINPKLHPVRTAIERFFGHFPNSDFSGLAGEEEQDDTHLSPLAIKKNNQHININQLSDGEKQIILYVADVASRLSIANPGLEDTNQGYGVVLIDEIEAHLHPSWQRNIIPALIGTFPNIQFFMTTHSPQIITNVKRENIKIIEDFKIVENTPHSYGRDANNILYNIFGVEERLPQIQEKFNKLYDLIDDEKTNGAAKKLMKEMKEILGEDDPEVQRANTYLKFNS